MARTETNRNEQLRFRCLIINNKYFLEPTEEIIDIKTLFLQLAAEGVGRPVDSSGFSMGPWTPEALADEISSLAVNQAGVEIRTVQHWFQNNGRGISAENIRSLACVFGCGNPEAISKYQKKLTLAQAELLSRRKKADRSKLSSATPNAKNGSKIAEGPPPPKLQLISEKILSDKVSYNLPLLVIAGAIGLCYLSKIFDIHSIQYAGSSQLVKQVGFIWAPNWTVTFIVWLPLFLAFMSGFVGDWKVNSRRIFTNLRNPTNHGEYLSWEQRVAAYKFTFWAISFVSFGITFLVQWVDGFFVPIMTESIGDVNAYWGNISLFEPERIGAYQLLIFSFVAYFYMGFCIHFYFSGLLFVNIAIYDLCGLDQVENAQRNAAQIYVTKAENCLLRCTILGVLISTMLKAQRVFLSSDAGSILSWLVDDFSVAVGMSNAQIIDDVDVSLSTHLSSLVIVLLTVGISAHGALRLSDMSKRIENCKRSFGIVLWRAAAVVLSILNYFFLGSYAGFSVTLLITLVVAIYVLYDPDFSRLSKESRQ